MAQANIDGPVCDPAGPYVFRKEGEYWTLAYAGPVFWLRHVKGMGYLAHLLGRPGERFPAAELLKATAQGTEDGNGRTNHRPGTRDQEPTSERARLAVTQCIKAALKKIGNHDPSLGHHLSTCVRTGHVCTYVPDPARRIQWVVQ